MMTSSSRMLRGAGFGAAALVLSAGMLLAPRTADSAPQVIRYSTGGGIGPNEIETVVFLDWMKQNVLKRHGKDYTLQMSFARGTPEAASLLAAGQIDIATLSYPIFATSILKDAVPGGITAIADIYQAARPGFHSNSYWCREDSGIQKIADLKGKTIAVNAFGASTDLVLRVALKKNGLDPKRDIRVVEVGFPAMAAAIREKRIDCGILVLPFSAVEVPKGGLRAIFNETAAFGPYSVIFQTVSNNFLKANPAAVKAYLADYVEGMHWLYQPENRAEGDRTDGRTDQVAARGAGKLLPDVERLLSRSQRLHLGNASAADGRCAGRERPAADAGSTCQSMSILPTCHFLAT